MRNLMTAACVCLVVCAMASPSEAGVGGKSFKIESSAGTLTSAAFEDNFFGTKSAGVLVHTPEGDVEGIYTERAALAGLITALDGIALDNGYFGTFQAFVFDFQFTTPGTATIVGFGTGITGQYIFWGSAKK